MGVRDVSSWFREEFERSKRRNKTLDGHGMVVTGTGFDVPIRPTKPPHLYPWEQPPRLCEQELDPRGTE